MLTITNQFNFFLVLVRFLRKSYSVTFLGIFKRTVHFVITNQVLDLLIPVSITYFLLFMTSMHDFFVNSLKLWERFFLIYIKPLIEYCIKSSSTNEMNLCNRYASKIVTKPSSKETQTSSTKWWMNVLHRHQYFLVHHRVL